MSERRTPARDENEYFKRGKADAKKRIAEFLESFEKDEVPPKPKEIENLLDDIWLVRDELMAWATRIKRREDLRMTDLPTKARMEAERDQLQAGVNALLECQELWEWKL